MSNLFYGNSCVSSDLNGSKFSDYYEDYAYNDEVKDVLNYIKGEVTCDSFFN